MSRTRVVVGSLVMLIAANSAFAHYLWVTVDKKKDSSNVANLYFEGGPGPGDGKYLDPFVKHGVMWVRTQKNGDPQKIKMEVAEQPKKRWLTAKLDKSGATAIESYGKWGVYRYGKTDVLLHYNAKNLNVANAEELSQLGRAKHLSLDIVPRLGKEGVEIQILWKGKPAAGRPVIVRGAGLKSQLKTDKEGIVRIEPKSPGRIMLRTNFEDKKTGTDDGKDYQLIRHHCTMLVRLPKDSAE